MRFLQTHPGFKEYGVSLIETCLVVLLVALVAIPMVRKIPIGVKDTFCKVKVEGLMAEDAATVPGDGTCWVMDENYELVQVW